MSVINRFLIASVLVVLFMSSAIRVSTTHSESMWTPVVAQKVVPLPPFSSVELHDGAKVILQHGPSQRVTLLRGSLDYTRFAFADGGRLVIYKCKSQCPRGYDLEIEIVTPNIARLLVADGGTIQSRGSFPRQSEIGVAVNNGGTIDIRSMAVASVSASVISGGRILTRPQTALFAKVVDGGVITHWGDASVSKSIQGGGVVTRGTTAEEGEPLSELSPPLPSVPPIAPLPVQPPRNPGR